MDRARLKTFVLILLVLVNLTFLSLIVTDAISSMRRHTEARAELVRVLEDMGISIEESQIPYNEEQTLYFLSRDFVAEGRIAAAVLGGTATAIDEGGGIVRYENPDGLGEGEVRSSTFRFQLANQQLDTESYERLLNQLELSVRDLSISVGKADNWQTHGYQLTFAGVRVVNGRVSFTFCFDNGMLQEVSGTALWGNVQRYTGSPQLDVTTALVSLAGHLLEREGVSRFEHVEMGYYLHERTGLLGLRPVWVVETDVGTFSIDRQNGEIR